MSRHFALLFLTTMLVVSSFAVSACATPQHEEMAVTLVSMDAMPMQVQRQPHRVAQSYRFAAANADLLQHMPCYCGCGPMGHDSNYDCYWQENGAFDDHATGCGICVDITQDVMKGLQQGRSPTEIRAQVDKDYARFGDPTHTPLPVAAAQP